MVAGSFTARMNLRSGTLKASAMGRKTPRMRTASAR